MNCQPFLQKRGWNVTMCSVLGILRPQDPMIMAIQRTWQNTCWMRSRRWWQARSCHTGNSCGEEGRKLVAAGRPWTQRESADRHRQTAVADKAWQAFDGEPWTHGRAIRTTQERTYQMQRLHLQLPWESCDTTWQQCKLKRYQKGQDQNEKLRHIPFRQWSWCFPRLALCHRDYQETQQLTIHCYPCSVLSMDSSCMANRWIVTQDMENQRDKNQRDRFHWFASNESRNCPYDSWARKWWYTLQSMKGWESSDNLNFMVHKLVNIGLFVLSLHKISCISAWMWESDLYGKKTAKPTWHTCWIWLLRKVRDSNPRYP